MEVGACVLQKRDTSQPLHLSISGGFDSSVFRPRYQRNNKRGGLKNLRCFPTCSERHKERGFCGRAVTIKLSHPVTNKGCPLYCWAQFVRCEEALPINVGDRVSHTTITEHLERSKLKPLLPLIRGDIVSEVDSISAKDSSSRVCTVFEFNKAKRGWHYGWASNKHTCNAVHRLSAYLLQPSKPQSNELTCVHVTHSPHFMLFCRRRRRFVMEPSAPVAPPAAKRARTKDNIVSHGGWMRKKKTCLNEKESLSNSEAKDLGAPVDLTFEPEWEVLGDGIGIGIDDFDAILDEPVDNSYWSTIGGASPRSAVSLDYPRMEDILNQLQQELNKTRARGTTQSDEEFGAMPVLTCEDFDIFNDAASPTGTNHEVKTEPGIVIKANSGTGPTYEELCCYLEANPGLSSELEEVRSKGNKTTAAVLDKLNPHIQCFLAQRRTDTIRETDQAFATPETRFAAAWFDGRGDGTRSSASASGDDEQLSWEDFIQTMDTPIPASDTMSQTASTATSTESPRPTAPGLLERIGRTFTQWPSTSIGNFSAASAAAEAAALSIVVPRSVESLSIPYTMAGVTVQVPNISGTWRRSVHSGEHMQEIRSNSGMPWVLTKLFEFMENRFEIKQSGLNLTFKLNRAVPLSMEVVLDGAEHPWGLDVPFFSSLSREWTYRAWIENDTIVLTNTIGDQRLTRTNWINSDRSVLHSNVVLERLSDGGNNFKEVLRTTQTCIRENPGEISIGNDDFEE